METALSHDLIQTAAACRAKVAVWEKRRGHDFIIAGQGVFYTQSSNKMGPSPMSESKANEPRRHHYVPRCWLAGFTDTGDKDGNLWVTDFQRRKQWQTSPGNAGFIKDFYRLTDEHLDPVLAEKAFSQVESEVAPILRNIDQDRRAPGVEEFDVLLYFIALQWARTPAFRPFVLNILDVLARTEIDEALKSPELWRRALEKAGISPDAPGAGYERMKKTNPDDFELSAPTDWYVQKMFEAADSILPSLRKRIWGIIHSPTGSFIGSDNPVAMDGPKGQKVGFENADIVTWPLSRHVLFYGTLEHVQPKRVNRRYIAHLNTLSLLVAEQQIFSHTPDFCWEDGSHKYHTDWTLFSKENY